MVLIDCQAKKIFEGDSILPSFLESSDPNAGENISILNTRKWVAFFKLKKPTGFDFEIGNVYAADGNLYIYDKNGTMYQIKEGYMGITKEVLVQKYDYKEINI
jgi:hypothetical protein